MKRPIPGGLLIAVEGIDGAGKTTIATLLAQWCGERGLGCVISKEPTGNKWGMQLRASAREGRLSVEEELKLLELDRKDHIARSIQPALDEENVMILDRYYWSTAAYQGSRGKDYNDIIAENEAFAPVPDLVILLDLDPDAGLQRIRMRGDKPNHFEDKRSLIHARQIFVQLAEKTQNSIVIDSSSELKASFEKALREFQTCAVNKISRAGTTPEHVQMMLDLFGGDSDFSESHATA